jgi:hypothetical protein
VEHKFVIIAAPDQKARDPAASITSAGQCQTCGWRGQVWRSHAEAEDAATKHPETG